MGAFSADLTRVVALIGHRSGGKTTLGDVFLEVGGATRTMGSVDEGTSLLDHEPEARRRRMTLGLSFAWLEWSNHLLQLVDTPGSDGLAYDQALALANVDAALVVVDAVAGPQVGGERALDECVRGGTPCMVVVNRLDRVASAEGCDAAVAAAVARTGSARAVALQFPAFDDRGRFIGVVPLLGQRLLRFAVDRSAQVTEEAIPDALAEAVRAARERLFEAIATTDDALLEHYLEHLELEEGAVFPALARAMARGQLVPFVYSAAALGLGAQPVLDAVVALFPSPVTRRGVWAIDTDGHEVRVDAKGPFVAQHVATRFDEKNEPYHVLRVWSGAPPRGAWVHGETGATRKIQKLYTLRGPRAATMKFGEAGSFIATWDALPSRPGDTWTDGPRWVLGEPPRPPPMMSWMLVPAAVRDAQRLGEALDRLAQFDPALEIGGEPLTGRAVLSGIGQDQLERAVEVLATRMKVQVEPAIPPIGYREMPAGSATGIIGEHQRGGDSHAEYGMCVVDIVPIDPGEGYDFGAVVAEDDVPDRFLPAIDEGIRRGMSRGPLAGYPVLGVAVNCVGGKYDILDSIEEHFVRAGELAIAAALRVSGTVLLEPWNRFEIRVPTEEIGLVLADLAARRGRVQGMEASERESTVFAECPLREMQTFGPRLQSLTGGRGRFASRPSHYDRVPEGLVREIVAASPVRDRTA